MKTYGKLTPPAHTSYKTAAEEDGVLDLCQEKSAKVKATYDVMSRFQKERLQPLLLVTQLQEPRRGG